MLKPFYYLSNFLLLQCVELPRKEPRLFGTSARTSSLSSILGDLGESGKGSSSIVLTRCVGSAWSDRVNAHAEQHARPS